MRNAQPGMHFDHTVADETIRIPQSAMAGSSTWLPAALLATLVILVSALQAFGDEPQQLQWRARTPAKSAQPNNKARPIVRHHVRRDVAGDRDERSYAVVQVAYDNFASEPQGEATLRSVVVHPRDAQFEGTGPEYRTAQDPFENDLFGDDSLDNGTLDNEIVDDINEPFRGGQAPELGIDELPEPVEPMLPDTAGDNQLDLDAEPRGDEPIGDDELFQNDPALQPGTGRGPTTTTPPKYDPRPQPRADRTAPNTLRPSINNPNASAKFDEERQKANESCDKALDDLRKDRITRIELSIRITGREGLDYPFECSLDDGSQYAGRHWPEVTYMWKAAANCHKPLYFEQVQLERYGHSWGPCVQPLVSGAHFFTRLPVLPYCMGITPPNECIYPLGYYRAGNCAPYMIPAVPFTWRAALFQAGATVGTAAVLP